MSAVPQVSITTTRTKRLNREQVFEYEGNTVVYEQRDASTSPGKPCIKTTVLSVNGLEPDRQQRDKYASLIRRGHENF